MALACPALTHAIETEGAAALEDLGPTAEELLADTETLTSILTSHVVAGEVSADDGVVHVIDAVLVP